jgi:lysozyme family protein
MPQDPDAVALSDTLRTQYLARWDRARIRPERVAQVDAIVDQIVANRARYEALGTEVPWYVIGALHNMEASLRFNAHLHNGDPLTARTVNVPAHRPASGSPPFTWEESARDALSRFRGMRNWSVAPMLWRIEKYNGMRYQQLGVPSPYLWSFTDQYTSGKITSDHGAYDPNVVSRQAGAAAILRRMQERGIIDVPRA